MKTTDLRRKSLETAMTQDDINVYTTKHYFYGLIIQNKWRQKIAERNALALMESQSPNDRKSVGPTDVSAHQEHQVSQATFDLRN